MRRSTRATWLWTLFLIVATVYVIRWVVATVIELWPFLVGGVLIASALWFLLWWRRHDRGYY